MAKLENGKYILTMKESDKVILNYIPVNGSYISFLPNKEYKLIVKDGIYTMFNEQYPNGLESLGMNSYDWFDVKKVA